MSTPQTHDTITTPAGVIKLITIDPASTYPPAVRARERQAKIRAELARGIKAPRPNFNARASRVSTYQDPGKIRTADQAVADLAKRADDETTARERARARPLFTGWALDASDGSFAIFRPALAGVEPARWTEPDWLGEIGADAWRAYGMARTMRARRTGGHSFVTWLIDPAAGRVTFASTDGDGDTSSAWGYLSDAINGSDARASLADEYIWPLRGVTWRIGRAHLTGGERADLVLQTRDNQIRVAIASSRLEGGAR
jgi:hypothetical protein